MSLGCITNEKDERFQRGSIFGIGLMEKTFGAVCFNVL
jgi:hypothetical protein